MLTLQYLEPSPHISEISPKAVQEKLQTAFGLLPVEALLLGWEIPNEFEEICRNVASRAETKLYRWHPLLTGDGTLYPKKEWRTQNLEGLPLIGFRGLPEFTFICPNNPAVREAALEHISALAISGRYEGIFLDRMRFPSPAADPANSLACFCEHCCRAATKVGLDLSDVCRTLRNSDKLNVLRALFGKNVQPLSAFLDFRQQTITRFIHEVVSVIRSSGLEVGLDCFSPTLAQMVGQDLNVLAPIADWTKIMVYAHAFGPATLPFEFTDFANWLTEIEGMSSVQALRKLSEITGFPLPTSLDTLRKKGFPSKTLAAEVAVGKQIAGNSQLLAGIELVEMPGISELSSAQTEADLRAIKSARADGLSLSWDLWHVPIERLELVKKVWFS